MARPFHARQKRSKGCAPPRYRLPLQEPLACASEGPHQKGFAVTDRHSASTSRLMPVTGLRGRTSFRRSARLSARGGAVPGRPLSRPLATRPSSSPSSDSAKFWPAVRTGGDSVVPISSVPVAASKTCTTCSRTSSSLRESARSMGWDHVQQLTAKRLPIREYVKVGHTQWPSRRPLHNFFPSVVHASRKISADLGRSFR